MTSMLNLKYESLGSGGAGWCLCELLDEYSFSKIMLITLRLIQINFIFRKRLHPIVLETCQSYLSMNSPGAGHIYKLRIEYYPGHGAGTPNSCQSVT